MSAICQTNPRIYESTNSQINEFPRIGIFICRCGSEIADALDIEEVDRYAKTLPNVVFVNTSPYPCSKVGLTKLKNAIKAQHLNRIIVAGCSPRLYENLFKQACEEAGLNRYLLEMVNIREHCSWVHRDREKATKKAEELIRMGVAKVSMSEPKEHIEVKLNPACLVIGAGISGISSALSLAKRGIPVKLIEKESEIGGLTKNLSILYPTFRNALDFIQEKIKAVQKNPNIELLVNTKVTKVTGSIGNYHITVHPVRRLERGFEPLSSHSFGKSSSSPTSRSGPSNGVNKQGNESSPLGKGLDESSFTVGAIIISTGAKVFEPEGFYGYDKKRVITQWEFERLLRNDSPIPDNIVMIQCVGSRNEEIPYCSRICCMTAIKNAIITKMKKPAAQVSILFRDIPVQHEKDFRKARALGINFFRFHPSCPPKVVDSLIRESVNSDIGINESTNQRIIELDDEISGDHFHIPYDLLILSTPLVARDDAEELSKILRIPMDRNRFLPETHVKLKPSDFVVDGIYIAGCAHWPCNIGESIAQGLGAASRAYMPLAAGSLRKEPLVFSVDPSICRGCERCVEICEHKAPEMVQLGFGLKQSSINEVLCKGCGICAVICPCGAITAHVSTDKEIEAVLEAAISSN